MAVYYAKKVDLSSVISNLKKTFYFAYSDWIVNPTIYGDSKVWKFYLTQQAGETAPEEKTYAPSKTLYGRTRE